MLTKDELDVVIGTSYKPMRRCYNVIYKERVKVLDTFSEEEEGKAVHYASQTYTIITELPSPPCPSAIFPRPFETSTVICLIHRSIWSNVCRIRALLSIKARQGAINVVRDIVTDTWPVITESSSEDRQSGLSVDMHGQASAFSYRRAWKLWVVLHCNALAYLYKHPGCIRQESVTSIPT